MTLCVNNVYIIWTIPSALLPHLPKAPKSLPSPKGSRESHKVSRSRWVNGMYHLHWGHGMFANRLTTEWWNVQMARRTLQPEGRANPGMEEKQVIKSHSNSLSFFIPSTPHPKEANKDDYITRIHQHVERKIRLIQLKKKKTSILFHIYVKMRTLKPHTFYNGEKQESRGKGGEKRTMIATG